MSQIHRYSGRSPDRRREIRLIGENLDTNNAEVIDAAGKYVFPGGVDVHTHMDLQAGKYRAVDDFYDGHGCGGMRRNYDHCRPHGFRSERMQSLASGGRISPDRRCKAVIDYGFHGVIQHVNDTVLKEMGEIAAQEGLTSFKVYTTYDFMIKDDGLYQVLKTG